MRIQGVLCGAVVLAVTLGAVSSRLDSSEPPATVLQRALDQAIDDERHAIALYDAVMAKHGQRRPFSNIIHAERRHEAALLAQYERLDLAPPEDQWRTRDIRVPKSFAEACDASIVAEMRNIKMYDQLLASVQDPEVQKVFRQLRRASAERHLRAFQRHGSGWNEVSEPSLTPTQQEQRTKAETAREAMFAALFAELARAIETDGPAAAITVCSEAAPRIASTIAQEHGVQIGRTSWKLRNSANQPPTWAQLAIDEHPETPRLAVDRSGRLGLLSPIRVSAKCLQCHGPEESISAEVRGRLADLYPDDEATGFSEGDLRGWFWIEVPPLRPAAQGLQEPAVEVDG